MIKVDGTYYWIGECKDSSGMFVANACYSSTDLRHWTFVNRTLVRQANGNLGPNRIVERHATYSDDAVGVATSSAVCGDYTYRGRLKLNGSTIRKWDRQQHHDVHVHGRPLERRQPGRLDLRVAAIRHQRHLAVHAHVPRVVDDRHRYRSGHRLNHSP